MLSSVSAESLRLFRNETVEETATTMATKKTPADIYELAPDSAIDALEALSGSIPNNFDVLDHIDQLKLRCQYRDQTPEDKRLLSREMREFFGQYARMVWGVCDLYWDAHKTGDPEKMQEAHKRGWGLLENLTRDFGEHSDQRTEAILLLHATARGRYSVFYQDVPLDEEIRALAEGAGWVESEMRPAATGGGTGEDNPTTKKRGRKPYPPKTHERDKKIWKLRKNGDSYDAIAAQFEMTVAAVKLAYQRHAKKVAAVKS